MELEEIAVTPDNFPPHLYITKLMKNKIYDIPYIIMPDLKPYEIEVRIITCMIIFLNLKIKYDE